MATTVAAATRAIVEMFARGDVDVASAVADNYLDHQGLGGVELRGPSGFRQAVAAARQLDDVRVTIEDLLVDEDKAAVRLRWHGVDRAGHTITRETLDLLRFDQNRLIEHWGAEISRRVDG